MVAMQRILNTSTQQDLAGNIKGMIKDTKRERERERERELVCTQKKLRLGDVARKGKEEEKERSRVIVVVVVHRCMQITWRG